MVDEFFEETGEPCDNSAELKKHNFFHSEKIDFIGIDSSISPGVKFAAVVYKPDKPAPILLVSHGWHMSVKIPALDETNPFPDFLVLQVAMRGRAFSTGTADCNGYELYDFYDAYVYAVARYSEYIEKEGRVFYYGSSGGGGNGLALAGKFPDLFSSCVIFSPIADYAKWYREDKVGEFRDEMDIWIGTSPDMNSEEYNTRSGIIVAENVLTPLYIAHGCNDLRVPVTHSRMYVKKAKELGKEIFYVENNAGGMEHWTSETDNERDERLKLLEKGLSKTHKAPVLPESGELIVAGYVKTKYFQAFMANNNLIGKLKYQIQKDNVFVEPVEGKMDILVF